MAMLCKSDFTMPSMFPPSRNEGQVHARKILHVDSCREGESRKPFRNRIPSVPSPNMISPFNLDSMGQGILRNLARANVEAQYLGPEQDSEFDQHGAFSSKSHAFAALSDLVRRYRYEYFLLAELPGFAAKTEKDKIVLSSLPPHTLDDLITFEFLDSWQLLFSVTQDVSTFQIDCRRRKTANQHRTQKKNSTYS